MNYRYKINSVEEYHSAYERSISDPEGFWAEIAAAFTWRKPWDKVLEWDFKSPKI